MALSLTAPQPTATNLPGIRGSSSTSSSWQQELAMREASEINTSSLAQNLPTDPQSWELNICWVLAADFYRS